MNSQDRIKEAGKALYMQGMSGEEISRVLGVSKTTVSNWTTAGNWREERLQGHLQSKTIKAAVMDLIEYQLSALQEMAEEGKSSGNMTLLDKGHIDALSKLFATVKGKELTWVNIVTVVRELAQYLNTQNPALAKELIPYTDEFLNIKREGMGA